MREIAATGTPESEHKLRLIITQLVELAGSKVHASRSGGIMGLASTACVSLLSVGAFWPTGPLTEPGASNSIALGPRLADYLGALIMPVLACFEDHDSKIRYYACESMYNIVRLCARILRCPLQLTRSRFPGQGSARRDPRLLQRAL